MSSSFVRYRSAGFWINDALLELWLRLLSLHLEEPSESGSLASRIRDQWLLASRGFFVGCVPVGLEEAVATDEGMSLVRAAVQSLLRDLRAAPPHLNCDVLNLLGSVSGVFMRDVETSKLVELGEAFLALLDGKITTELDDVSLFSGRQPRHDGS